MSDAYRLTFLLPQILLLVVPEGRHTPCLAGVVLIVDRGRVSIQGITRESVFDQAERFFRAHARKAPVLTLAAVLETPRRPGLVAGRDGYTIIVNAGVAFVPCPLGADARPALQLVGDQHRLAS